MTAAAEGPCVPVVAVVASAGRPLLLDAVIKDLMLQTYPALSIVVSVPSSESLPVALPEAVTVVMARGLPAQRNAGTRAASAPYYFFFDDDAVVRSDYIANAMTIFRQMPEVVGLTGRVLADGARPHADAVTQEEAERLLALSWAEDRHDAFEPYTKLYGCNMAYRAEAVLAPAFDERLPLYAWLEDLDLAKKLLRAGKIVRAADCVIVHRGYRSGGRTSHERLGYSHVMNPAYLHSKGSLGLRECLRLSVPRIGRNLVGLLVEPSARSWRRRRLVGHLKAVSDLSRGRITPERIIDLPPL